MGAGLTAFLERTADRPWVWGETDCTMWVADWCIQRWGVDPAAAFRGRYRNEAEMLALTANGLMELVAPCMTFARAVDEAQDGDVAVIQLPGKEVAAIRVGPHWAMRRFPDGLAFVDAPALAVWGD